jgi:beta-lactamase class A
MTIPGKSAGATGQRVFAAEAAGSGATADLNAQVTALFDGLPGTWAVKFLGTDEHGKPYLDIGIRPNQRLFVASAFKGFVLATRLKQLDTPDVVEKLEANMLKLDDSVWSFGSDIFVPPHLTGSVRERTAAEAMILHSDNTGTDMLMKVAGPGHIRQLIADLGLAQTQVPESTRVMAAYLFGFPNYKTATWAELTEAADRGAPMVHPFLNDVETMASSVADLVSLYARTLPGGFFFMPETQNEYRRILALADGVFEAVPFGTTGFAKTGYADVKKFHVRSNAGGMTFDGRWVYFAGVINWDAPEDEDPQTVTRWKDALRAALRLIRDSR